MVKISKIKMYELERPWLHVCQKPVAEGEWRINLILTFSTKPQRFFDFDVSKTLFESQEEVMKQIRTKFKSGGLWKASLCRYEKHQHESNKELPLPAWYKDCNGKLYF